MRCPLSRPTWQWRSACRRCSPSHWRRSGRPGVDRAAHQHLTSAFAGDGWRFWDNYWYAGRYELVNYSLLYYPLAALVGYLTVAVVAVVAGAGLFASAVLRQWGRPARLSALLFAAFWPGVLIAGQYPFALGCAFALAALVALQRDRPGPARPVLPHVAAREPARASCCSRSTLVGLTAAQSQRLVLRRRVSARVRDRAALRSRSCSSSARSPPAARSPTPGSTSWGSRASPCAGRCSPAAIRARGRSWGCSSPTWCSAGPRSCTRRRSAATPHGCSTTSRCRCWRWCAALRGFRPRLLVAVALGVASPGSRCRSSRTRSAATPTRRRRRRSGTRRSTSCGHRPACAATSASRSSRRGGTRRPTTCRRAGSRSPAAGTARTPTVPRICRATAAAP